METIINIYDDKNSELIFDNNFDPTSTEEFRNLGERISITEGDTTPNELFYENVNFLEMHVFDENDNFIITLNSGKPLLKQPSTGLFYFEDYHFHDPSNTYMVGKEHNPYQHEALAVIRKNQLNPYRYDKSGTTQMNQYKYAIKLSEVFEILKNIPNFTLEEKTTYKLQYGIFTNLLLDAAASLYFSTTQDFNLDPEDEFSESELS
jgi:hypothetical protein